MVFCRQSMLAVLILGLTVPTMAQWTNGQDASYVLGQSNFTNNGAGGGSQMVNRATGVAIDRPNGKLYVTDYIGNRVLRFAYPVTASYPTAERIFGIGAGTTSNTFLNPLHLAVDSVGNLYVGDHSNCRVLIFDSAYSVSTDGIAASRVLGQSTFTNSTGAAAVNRMQEPVGVYVDPNDTLWVSDRGNNRVLRFDNAPAKTTGANADGVLGQTSFTVNSSGTSSAKMNQPYHATMVGTTLFVADSGNSRVLRFDNAASKLDGAAADGVLGQPNFSSVSGSTGQSRLASPRGIACDLHGAVYVADTSNHRVMVFNNATAKADGANADFVIGQEDYTSNGPASDQDSFNTPHAIAVDSINNKLLVAEIGNHRVMVQSASSNLPVSVSNFNLD